MTLYLDMRFIDIHTHKAADNCISIVDNGESTSDNIYISAGIHPWEITPQWEEKFTTIKSIAERPNTVAIGECGFDYINSSASRDLQYRVFTEHLLLSEDIGKPLIIHLVKGQEDLLKASREHKHKQAWIIHGFRGKPAQAKQLLAAGFYLSLGAKFNIETARSIPLDRLFIESDMDDTPIHKVYENIAKAIGTTIAELANQIERNIKSCNISI
ncbi:MAG: TatD family hydrolase [Bacteroidaceae bacterium]|nr:TatD family hydrolase [Bacteroidaceae bacterium]